MEKTLVERQIEESKRKLQEMPDLQKLIDDHGGWNEITAEAWEQYWQEMEKWKLRYIYR